MATGSPHVEGNRVIGRVRIVSAGELRAGSGPLHGALPIDARGRRAYAEGHIPGAIRMGWEDWCEPAPDHAGPIIGQKGYWGVLDPLREDALRERLEATGLSSERPVVVYGDGPRTRGREGRIAWMLLYLGASDVSLLDGGWTAWLKVGGAAERETASPSRGRFEVRIDPRRRCTLAELLGAYDADPPPLPIDTRSREEFLGEQDEYLPRRGRLPGAILAPFTELFDEDGSFRSPPPVPSTARKIAYCEVGVRAALFALLHEIHTGEVVPVYDGSIMEWSLHAELPMESG